MSIENKGCNKLDLFLSKLENDINQRAIISSYSLLNSANNSSINISTNSYLASLLNSLNLEELKYARDIVMCRISDFGCNCTSNRYQDCNPIIYQIIKDVTDKIYTDDDWPELPFDDTDDPNQKYSIIITTLIDYLINTSPNINLVFSAAIWQYRVANFSMTSDNLNINNSDLVLTRLGNGAVAKCILVGLSYCQSNINASHNRLLHGPNWPLTRELRNLSELFLGLPNNHGQHD